MGVSFDYRLFQKVLDLSKLNDPRWQGRTPEACVRCHSRRSKCDGRKPCRRCQHSNTECIYIQGGTRNPSTIPVVTSNLFQNVVELEKALDETSAEMVRLQVREEVTSECAVKKRPRRITEGNGHEKHI